MIYFKNCFLIKFIIYDFVLSEYVIICSDVLLESDRRGIESHGVNRFKPIYIDRIKAGIQNPVTNFEIIRETKTTAVVDGHDGMGQVIGYKAMQMAIDKAKSVKPNMKLGVCGEHGGDPASVEFCHNVGLDYVSCSPYRVPIARLSAAQAALRNE